MLRRCVLRCPQPTPRRPVYSHFEPSPFVFTRPSSTTDRSRRLPRSTNASKLKSWQRVVLVSLGAGLLFSQAVLYYNNRYAKDSFVVYRLVAKTPVSSTASVFHLEPKDSSQDQDRYQDAWKRGIWNFQFKQPQIQIVRAYTPLPPLNAGDDKQDGALKFLIRHDRYGEMSNYLHRLPLGADIEMRGPNLEYQLTPNTQQVVFFAGGTGIAPALQIAHAMFSTQTETVEGDNTQRKRKLHILWANRKREDCRGGISDAPATEPIPPKASWSGLFMKQKDSTAAPIGDAQGPIVQELENLKQKYPGQVTVEYFVNAEGTWIDEDVVIRTLSRFDDKDFSTGNTTAQEQRQILISGPSGFISYLAGPKEWRNGREEQGHVSKIVAHAIAQNPHHVKVWKI